MADPTVSLVCLWILGLAGGRAKRAPWDWGGESPQPGPLVKAAERSGPG